MPRASLFVSAQTPFSNAVPYRRRGRFAARLVALTAAVALSGACSNDADRAPIQRLIHRPGAFRPDVVEAIPAEGSVRFDAANDAPSDWLPIVRLAEAPAPGEVEAFLASSSIEAGGRVRFGTERGSWLRVVPVAPNTPLVLRARIGLSAVPLDEPRTGARIALVEFSARPTPGDPQSALAAKVVTHWGQQRVGDGVIVDETIVAKTSDATVAVGILCSVGTNPAPAGVAFDQIRLQDPVAADYFGELGLAPSKTAAGSCTIAMTTRPALPVAPGSALLQTVDLPPGESRFETFVGLVPHEHFPAGSRVRFTVAADGEALVTHEMVSADRIESRWQKLTCSLSNATPTARVQLELRAEWAEGDAADALVIPVFATPRIVPAEPQRPHPNVVLISIDTLRADHVGCYGYDPPTTPRIDAFAQDARVYLHTWAQGAYTLPSHMSMLSGQYASVHGVQDSGDGRDRGRTRLLAEILSENGFTTAGFTAGGYLDPAFGFDRGFERYSTVEVVHNTESPRQRARASAIPGYSPELVEEYPLERIQDWIRDHANESFFLFFHTYAAHEFDPPRRLLDRFAPEVPGLSDDLEVQRFLGMGDNVPPPNSMPDDVRDRIIALYDGGILQADEAVGALLDTLEQLDLLEDTIVIITSDHGKEIGEHGQVGHGHVLYEEMVSIPLIVRIPGYPAARIETAAASIDIVPTVLELLRIPSPRMQGANLLFLPDQRPLFTEVDALAVKYALLNGSEKTIYSPLDAEALLPNSVAEESFDLASDPLEQAPLEPSDERVERVKQYRDALRTASENMATGDTGTVNLDASSRELLNALGYTQEKEP